jgi:penicillin-binding protein 1C
MARALRLEALFSKDEILEQYLNRLPFGDQIVGVERASEEYFGVPSARLSVGQAALLAGIPQAPSATEPRRHMPRALARRRLVLRRMLASGRIDAAAHRAALAETPLVRDEEPRPWRAPRFVDDALRAWRAGDIERDGAVLRTSLDLGLQRDAETILRRAVADLERRGVSQGAAVAVVNATGEILAHVGAARPGADQPAGQMNLVAAPRQPGSTLKPFVYGLFFENGGTAASLLDDVARPMTGAAETIFEAEDYDGRERGPVRARVALASSLNLAALDAARRVGQHRIVERLAALGVGRLADADRYGGAIVLGGADVTVAELAVAYATLARGGSRVPLAFGAGGGAHEPVVVMDPRAAALVDDILRDERARADAFGDDLAALADGLEDPFGLKTGTSSGWHDAWAAVFTDLVTVIVWLGDPGGAPLGGVSGFEGAAPPAVRLLAAAHRRAEQLGFAPAARMAMSTLPDAEPVELTSAAICAHSGLLAGDRCSVTVDERFAPGTLPAARCDQHDARGTWTLPHRYAEWIGRTHPAGVVLPASVDVHPEAVLRIVNPSHGARWLIDPSRGETHVPLRAELEGATPAEVVWEVDGARLAGQSWRARPGRHTFVAIVRQHRSEPVALEVVTAGDG